MKLDRMEQIGVRVDKSFIAGLKKFAKANGISFSVAVRQAIIYFLAAQRKEPKS